MQWFALCIFASVILKQMMTLFVSVVSQHSISNHSNKLIFNVKYNLGYNFKQLANSTELLSFSKKKNQIL